MRDEQGIKFQAVVYNNAANYEGVVNVKNTTVEDDSALVYWVTGVIAGCEINKSNTKQTTKAKTGDNANIIGLMMLLVSSMFVMVFVRKKEN